MNKNKILICAATFIVSAALGFGGTKLIKGDVSFGSDTEEETSDIVSMSEDSSGETHSSASTAKISNEPKVDTVASNEIEAIEKPSVEDMINAEKERIAREEAAKKVAEESKARAEANKMSASEFQALLLSSDPSILGGKNPKVAKNISFSFSGLREGEKRPGDVVAIRQKISMGQWEGAAVVGVGYDNAGKINSVTVRPIYGEE